eukprot:COSAG04_NODE_1327_length_7206_cov_5.902806_4_plen_113_part_00
MSFEDLRSAELRASDSGRLDAFSQLFWEAVEGMTEEERLALAFFSCGASTFVFVDTVWRVSSAAFGRTASMTVLESLTVNLRELEVTAKGGECETISSRQVCTRPCRCSWPN